MLNYLFENHEILAICVFGTLGTIIALKFIFSSSKKKEPTFLRGKSIPVMGCLSERKMLNHDTMLIKLKLPGKNLLLGLPVG